LFVSSFQSFQSHEEGKKWELGIEDSKNRSDISRSECQRLAAGSILSSFVQEKTNCPEFD